MDVTEALAALELGPAAGWEQIRAAYRRLLRAHHPDVTDAPGAADRTARLTGAYAVLAKATDGGRRPLPPSARPAGAGTRPRPPSGSPRRGARPAGASAPGGRTTGGAAAAGGATQSTGEVSDRRSPEEVFARLRAAAGAVGTISGIDPESLTLQILVEAPGSAPGQLLAEVGRRGDETTIMFTLESLSGAPGPPIEAVVRRLLARL